MPAEWARQRAVMLTWPHSGTDWQTQLEEADSVFLAIARAVLQRQDLLISCQDRQRAEELRHQLSQAGSDHGLIGKVTVIEAPADDTWARDHGPITVVADGQTRLLDFRFNAWGGKFDYHNDDQLNQRLVEAGGFGDLPLVPIDLVLEGGSIESDGAGTLLTTSECLLTPTRNPSLDRTGLEEALCQHLGAKRILWLNHGYLAGDDTDSHVDTLARFCAPDSICYVACNDPDDEHYPALKAMEEDLREFRQSNGEPYRLTPLPWPDPIHDEDGNRLPATYANFLIINDAVLLPIYGVPQDGTAIKTLADLFPQREVVPIDCRALIRQHGSLHCVTMQIPDDLPSGGVA